MKKMFLMAIVAAAAVSVSFGGQDDCIREFDCCVEKCEQQQERDKQQIMKKVTYPKETLNRQLARIEEDFKLCIGHCREK